MNETDARLLDQLWSPEPPPIPVDLGRWHFELRGDEIADLSYDGSAVARSVRVVARDRDWNTVPTTVRSFEPTAHGFRLELTLRGFGADISATVDIVHRAVMLTFSLEATSHSEFLTNRLGLVVLHPPSFAGESLTVGTAHGDVRTAFPVAIAPHQPAVDIRSLAWTHDGVGVYSAFAGDTFEMEDQRNWTDASYKTYSRPLALPFPYGIDTGQTVRQSVSFTATRVSPRAHRGWANVVELVGTGRRVPEVTLGASTVPDAAMPAGHGQLPRVGALLVELDTRTPSWQAALARAATEAGELPLDVRIVSENDAALRAAVDEVADTGVRVTRLGTYSGLSHVTEPALWDALTDAAGTRLPEATLIGGARSHFTELNREHGRLPAGIRALTFSMTPQMHATERAQLVESIPMHTVVVRSAGDIARGRPLHVGPITLAPRFNAVATSGSDADASPGLESGYGAELTVGATDPRQQSDALEAWTVASFAAIAAATDRADVASVSYFEASGPRGLGDGDHRFPVARAISSLAGLAGGELLVPARATSPGLWCVGSRSTGGEWRVVLANLGTDTVSAEVSVEGSSQKVELEPFAVLRLTSQTDAEGRLP
jgi:hypothetical protein